MSADDLVTRLRAGGDPLQMRAAEALIAWCAEVERLRERVALLEAVARLTAETIRNMQLAAAETERVQFRSVTR